MQTIKLNVTIDPCPVARPVTLYPSTQLSQAEQAKFIYNELVEKFGTTWTAYTIRK